VVANANRLKLLKKADYTCELCHIKKDPDALDIHHAEGGVLQVVCRSCHWSLPRTGGTHYNKLVNFDDVSITIQGITKIGNSHYVAIPSMWMKQNNLKRGDDVIVVAGIDEKLRILPGSLKKRICGSIGEFVDKQIEAISWGMGCLRD